jgi:hypothetical protein
LVTFETLCWNRKHVLSNLGSLTGVYSCFSSCPKKFAVTFGCSYLSQWARLDEFGSKQVDALIAICCDSMTQSVYA